MLSFSCAKKENPVELGYNYGIIEGIVRINPYPYVIGSHGGGYGAGGTPYVEIRVLGESNTTTYVGGWDFYNVGNTEMYEASFKLGDYDGNESAILPIYRGVIPGIYSVKFCNGFFENSQGQIDLEEIIVSTIGDTPIEVMAGQTTHIGVITLTPE